MIIDGFQKLTLLDYPKNLACIVFTRGCNFDCPFCQNSSLIGFKDEKGLIDESEIFDYLEKRKKVLDGVVITGGEPLIQKDIESFIKKIRSYDLKVKLDTNGSNPNLLKKLIDEHLIDYVAMDIKNTKSKYDFTCGKKIKIDDILKSIKILKENKIDYEFRTTIMKEMHTISDIREICEMIGKNSKYYLQNFESSDDVRDENLHPFSRDELEMIYSELKEEYPNLVIRALD